MDAGLAFGRSFRVSWGPGGQLARIGGPSRFLYHIYIPVHLLILLISSIIHVDVIPMATEDEVSDNQYSNYLQPPTFHFSL